MQSENCFHISDFPKFIRPQKLMFNLESQLMASGKA